MQPPADIFEKPNIGMYQKSQIQMFILRKQDFRYFYMETKYIYFFLNKRKGFYFYSCDYEHFSGAEFYFLLHFGIKVFINILNYLLAVCFVSPGEFAVPATCSMSKATTLRPELEKPPLSLFNPDLCLLNTPLLLVILTQLI